LFTVGFGWVPDLYSLAGGGGQELAAEEQIVCSVGEGGIGKLGQIGISGNDLD